MASPSVQEKGEKLLCGVFFCELIAKLALKYLTTRLFFGHRFVRIQVFAPKVVEFWSLFFFCFEVFTVKMAVLGSTATKLSIFRESSEYRELSPPQGQTLKVISERHPNLTSVLTPRFPLLGNYERKKH